jgi:hypothetical protein
MAGDTPVQAPPPAREPPPVREPSAARGPSPGHEPSSAHESSPAPGPWVLQPRIPAPARPPRRRGPSHAILNALMSLAVTVLERRIRKALRSGSGTSGQPGSADTGGQPG